MRTDLSLAGAISLSSWLPLRAEYPEAMGPTAKGGLRVWMGHGDADQVVPLQWGKSSKEALEALGIQAILFPHHTPASYPRLLPPPPYTPPLPNAGKIPYPQN